MQTKAVATAASAICQRLDSASIIGQDRFGETAVEAVGLSPLTDQGSMAMSEILLCCGGWLVPARERVKLGSGLCGSQL